MVRMDPVRQGWRREGEERGWGVHLQQVRLKPHHEALALGVAEAHVVLQELHLRRSGAEEEGGGGGCEASPAMAMRGEIAGTEASCHPFVRQILLQMG